jgi:hypothetical protein
LTAELQKSAPSQRYDHERWKNEVKNVVGGQAIAQAIHLQQEEAKADGAQAITVADLIAVRMLTYADVC